MALPSSGPLSFQDIATELGVNPPLSLAAMSTTAGFAAPYAVTNFYGYGGATPDVVTNGLVLYLDAGQTTSYSGSGSTWTDLSGYGNNATLVNNPTYSSSNNGSIIFNGSNQYADLGNPASLDVLTWTIAAWTKSISFTYYQNIIAKGDNTAGQYGIIIDGSGNWAVQPNTGFNTTPLSLGSWNYIVGISDGSQITTYINGILVAQYSMSSSNHGTGVQVGTDLANNRYFNGNIAVSQIYNRALTNAEVVQNYNAFASRYNYTPLPITSGLTLLLDAKNTSSYSGSGTSWNDVSGNNNNGTFNVAPTYNAGGYFQLNGSQIVQSFPSSISPTLSSKTIIVWFNIADTTRRGLIATRDSGSTGGWAFVVNRTATGNLTFFNVAGGGLIEKSGGITPSNWYMATLTYNYSTLDAELFVNGISVGTQSSIGAGSNVAFNGVVAAEEQNDFAGAFSGGYSIVNIYNRVLTPSEIIFNYNAYASRFGLTPIGIVTTGLTFNFDAANYSGTGNTWTDNVSNNVGTLIDNPTYSTDNGGYFTFNGSSNYVTVPDNPTLSFNPYLTLEAWVYPTDNNYNMIITKQPSGGQPSPYPGNYEVRVQSSNILYLGWQYDYPSQYAYSTMETNGGAFTLNAWNQVLVTSETVYNTQWYVNGVAVTTNITRNQGPTYGNPPPMAVNNQPLLLGKRQDGLPFAGKYAIARGYNIMLTPSQVLQNYNVTKARFGL